MLRVRTYLHPPIMIGWALHDTRPAFGWTLATKCPRRLLCPENHRTSWHEVKEMFVLMMDEA